jgi:glycosyltransferase involved in cell wall biosynthesis
MVLRAQKISVSLASYNGGTYIDRQINSILPQMADDDELIISDDGSTDKTIEIIGRYADERIKLIRNPARLGVIKNFEKCISQAHNDFIFLADQDDEWMPERVERVLEIFENHPDITLVLSNAVVIDGADKVINESFFKFYNTVGIGLFRVFKNIIKNNYIGAMIAFRKNMTKYILPIPSDIPMHDVWIGILNDIYGRTYYLDEPLIRYRRHANNTTGDKHASLSQMAKWRYMLIKRLFNKFLH